MITKGNTLTSLARLVLGAVFALAGSARASADDIALGQATYGGTGCPTGTASVVLGPDSTSLSILFDQYTVEAGGVTGRVFDRKACNLAVPVHVPQGLSVAVLQVDYRGFAAVPDGGEARFSAEYFLAGGAGILQTRTLLTEDSGEFLISNQTASENLVWSECGTDAILRVNSSLVALADADLNQTLASVDTADAKASLVYRLQWRQCGD